MAAQYNVVRNRPIWVDISIPSSAASDSYSGTLRVTQNERVIATLKMEVEVCLVLKQVYTLKCKKWTKDKRLLMSIYWVKRAIEYFRKSMESAVRQLTDG